MTESTQSAPQLHMVRNSLAGLPEVDIPADYEIRTYIPGDAENWERIITISFDREDDPIRFEEVMESDPAFSSERIFFVICNSEAVATASAYYRDAQFPDKGMLHYVGVLPGHTGKKLGYWVSLVALHRMTAEGRQGAWLSTDDFRLPAIKTYLNLGFQPFLVDENQSQRWKRVFSELGCFELTGTFRSILEGPVSVIDGL